MILSVPDYMLDGLKLQGDLEKVFHFDVDGSDYVGIIKTVLPGTSPDWYVCLYVPEKVLFSNAYWHFYLAIGILAVMIISVILSLITGKVCL